MTTLDDDELHELITHPDAPTSRVFRADGNSVAEVNELVKFVQRRSGCSDAHEIESALDAYIRSQGGDRAEVIDLNNLLARLWGRRRGRPSPPPPMLYEIPRRLFEEKGRQQGNVVLRPTDYLPRINGSSG